MNKFSRRRFLGQAGCAAMGSVTFLSSLTNMGLLNTLANSYTTNNDDYKAVVCLLLAGGNDSYNMLVPNSGETYTNYQNIRGFLGLNQSEIRPLNFSQDPLGRTFGVHPNMPHTQNLFNSGDLAFVANVGTLIEPVPSVADYESGLKQLPLGLFSHSDQIEQWQTSVPHDRSAIGWGGKMADILQGQNSNQAISMNISLSGRNIFQAGNTLTDFSISRSEENGVTGIEQYKTWLSNSGFIHQLRAQAIDNLSSQVYSNILKNAFGGITKSAFEHVDFFSDALSTVPDFSTDFSDHYVSQSLRMVAKTIAARGELGVNRQTFFLTFGGWDHHDSQLNQHPAMLGQLDRAIFDFMNVLEELDMKDKVTLFTISDFGRTLSTNGNGTDHAWGGNCIVAGGAVSGGHIYGMYPEITTGISPLMTDQRGRFIPTLSTDEYFAELAIWLGVPRTDLTTIFPNLAEFYAPFSNEMPIGFLPT